MVYWCTAEIYQYYIYLPTGHYYPGSRGPFSKYFGTSCEFWSEHFKRAKVVHTWVSVVARKLPSSLLPLKKVCVVGIQKRGGKLRARDEGQGTRCTVISPPTKSPPRSLLTPDNNSAIIDTVYLPGIVTSSSSLNISLQILIDTLRRTSHLFCEELRLFNTFIRLICIAREVRFV